MSLLRYLDPEALLNLKATLPDLMEKCKPEYPHVEHLPGLTLAFKSKCYLVKKGGKGSRLLSQSRAGQNEDYRRCNRDKSAVRPCLYEGVVIMSLDNHRPFSYETNEDNKYHLHYNQVVASNPFSFPYVKPGDIFSKLQTGDVRVCSLLGSEHTVHRVLPSVVFANSAGRFKYHYVQAQKTLKQAYEYYKTLGTEPDPHPYATSLCLIDDIRYGLIYWDYPFDLNTLIVNLNWERFHWVPNGVIPARDLYTATELRNICVKMGLPTTGDVWEMCESIYTFIGLEN